MISLARRRQIKSMLELGRTQAEAARLAGVSIRSVKRIAKEPISRCLDDVTERRQRRIGRPSKTRPFMEFVEQLVMAEPDLASAEILRRALLAGYAGRKSAMYELVALARRSSERRPLPVRQISDSASVSPVPQLHD